MSAQHVTVAAIVVDIAREKAIREALNAFLAAADALALAAGSRALDISLGTQPAIYEVARASGWSHYVNPGSDGVGFGVASDWRRAGPAHPTVYGPDIPTANLAPTTDASAIVIRPLGLGG